MKTKMMKLMIIAPLAIVGMALFIVIGGEVVRQLWNWLLPSLFAFPRITFWQALGLLALCRILFGGFGMRGSGRSKIRRRVEERVDERWACMNPEDRERFRQRMRDRFGFDPGAGESKAP